MSNLILTIETFKSDELDFENLVQMLSTIVSPQSCIVVSFLKSHILARLMISLSFALKIVNHVGATSYLSIVFTDSNTMIFSLRKFANL